MLDRLLNSNQHLFAFRSPQRACAFLQSGDLSFDLFERDTALSRHIGLERNLTGCCLYSGANCVMSSPGPWLDADTFSGTGRPR